MLLTAENLSTRIFILKQMTSTDSFKIHNKNSTSSHALWNCPPKCKTKNRTLPKCASEETHTQDSWWEKRKQDTLEKDTQWPHNHTTFSPIPALCSIAWGTDDDMLVLLWWGCIAPSVCVVVVAAWFSKAIRGEDETFVCPAAVTLASLPDNDNTSSNVPCLSSNSPALKSK